MYNSSYKTANMNFLAKTLQEGKDSQDGRKHCKMAENKDSQEGKNIARRQRQSRCL